MKDRVRRRGVDDRAHGAETWQEPAREPDAPTPSNASVQRLFRGGRQARRKVSTSREWPEADAEHAARLFAAAAPLSANRARAARSGAPPQRVPEATRGDTEGFPIADDVRHQYELFFHADLSTVRLHTDDAAARAAWALRARAFTTGADIFFGRSRYDPVTQSGRELLAHELAHVLQHDAAEVLRRQADDNAPPPAATAPPTIPPIIALLPTQPWFYTVSVNTDPAAISHELYGTDLSITGELNPLKVSIPLVGEFEGGRIAYPDLLTPSYRTKFHAAMQALLDEDVSSLKSVLLETYIDGDDERKLVNITARWSERRDIRTESGQTYFDAFLARLHDGRMYVDYGVFEGKSRSYYDEMYGQLEEKAGEFNTLVAQNSREYGGYRPVWAELEERAVERKPTTLTINEDLVSRSEEMIIDAMEGFTSEDDSKIITDTLSGLPAIEKAAVLRRIMRRYDETDWTGIFGRFGEAWEGGMLYYLFEDLEDEDKEKVARSLVESGIMSEQAAATLVAGRGLAGEYLPWTTYHGHKAAEFWAEIAVENEDEWWSFAPMVMGGFASLWTPETAGHTILTLGTAGLAPGIAAASPTLGKGLLIAGTGLTAFSTTIAIQELATGRDMNGRQLDDTEKLARLLNVVSGVLMLGAGFMGAAQMGPPTPGRGMAPALDVARPELPGLGPGSARGIPMRVVRAVGDEYTVIGQSPETGELAVLRINVRTGAGTLMSASTGEVVPVSGWGISKPLTALPAPPAATPPLEMVPSPTRPPAPQTLPPGRTPPPPTAIVEEDPFGVPELFSEAQALVPDEALVLEAIESGELGVGQAPVLYQYDPISGDYLPSYYNPETGMYAPYSMEPLRAGNVFNELGNWGYPVHELALRTRVPAGRGSRVFLDSYDPAKGEIVSRKHTQLGALEAEAARDYVQELVVKYRSGARIASTPSTKAMGVAGQVIRGRQVLEVPVQLYEIPDSVLEYANSRGVIIRDTTGHVYNP